MKSYFVIQGFSTNIKRVGIAKTIIIILERVVERFFPSDDKDNRYRKKLLLKKHSIINNYLIAKYNFVLKSFINEKNQGIICPNGVIWICWWQSEENAPDLVKKCIGLIRKNSNGHQVVIINKNNYKEYVNIPTYILNKVNSGIITLTHFSDILRMALLSEHGGFWLDATVLVTNIIPETIFKAHLFSRKGKPEGYYVSECRWTGFLIGGSKGCILFDFVKTMFYEYWKEENNLIDYFLIDNCIAVGYEQIPTIKELVDNLEYNNPQIHVLCPELNNTFSPKQFENILLDTDFHKLSWKGNLQKYCTNGDLTNYGYILSEM